MNLPLGQTELSFNQQPASLFDLAKASDDSDFGFGIGLPDVSDYSLFQDVNSNIIADGEFIPHSPILVDNALLGDDPFTLADCSTSDNLPVIDKRLRARRRDDHPGSCKAVTDAANTPSSDGDGDPSNDLPDTSLINEVLTDPELALKWAAAKNNENHNSNCYFFTDGYLPWGVCSSGNAADMSMSMTSAITIGNLGEFGLWTLNHCTLGTFDRKPTCNVNFNFNLTDG